MLTEQINALITREEEIVLKIERFEDDLKKTKTELAIIKRARTSLERLEEQLNGQVNVLE